MHWLIQTHRCPETGHRSAGEGLMMSTELLTHELSTSLREGSLFFAVKYIL